MEGDEEGKGGSVVTEGDYTLEGETQCNVLIMYYRIIHLIICINVTQ